MRQTCRLAHREGTSPSSLRRCTYTARVDQLWLTPNHHHARPSQCVMSLRSAHQLQCSGMSSAPLRKHDCPSNAFRHPRILVWRVDVIAHPRTCVSQPPLQHDRGPPFSAEGVADTRRLDHAEDTCDVSLVTFLETHELQGDRPVPGYPYENKVLRSEEHVHPYVRGVHSVVPDLIDRELTTGTGCHKATSAHQCGEQSCKQDSPAKTVQRNVRVAVHPIQP